MLQYMIRFWHLLLSNILKTGFIHSSLCLFGQDCERKIIVTSLIWKFCSRTVSNISYFFFSFFVKVSTHVLSKNRALGGARLLVSLAFFALVLLGMPKEGMSDDTLRLLPEKIDPAEYPLHYRFDRNDTYGEYFKIWSLGFNESGITASSLQPPKPLTASYLRIEEGPWTDLSQNSVIDLYMYDHTFLDENTGYVAVGSKKKDSDGTELWVPTVAIGAEDYELPLPVGYTEGIARSISNDFGIVVGEMSKTDEGTSSSYPYVWLNIQSYYAYKKSTSTNPAGCQASDISEALFDKDNYFRTKLSYPADGKSAWLGQQLKGIDGEPAQGSVYATADSSFSKYNFRRCVFGGTVMHGDQYKAVYWTGLGGEYYNDNDGHVFDLELANAQPIDFLPDLGEIAYSAVTAMDSETVTVYIDRTTTTYPLISAGVYEANNSLSSCFIWASESAVPEKDIPIVAVDLLGALGFADWTLDFSQWDLASVSDVHFFAGYINVLGRLTDGAVYLAQISQKKLAEYVYSLYYAPFTGNEVLYRFDAIAGAESENAILALGPVYERGAATSEYTAWQDISEAEEASEWEEIKNAGLKDFTLYDMVGRTNSSGEASEDGSYYSVGQYNSHAAVYDSSTATTETIGTITEISSTAGTSAYGISSDGLVAAGASSSNAYVWVKDNNWNEIDLGAGSAKAVALNSAKSNYVVVGAIEDTSNALQATYWVGSVANTVKDWKEQARAIRLIVADGIEVASSIASAVVADAEGNFIIAGSYCAEQATAFIGDSAQKITYKLDGEVEVIEQTVDSQIALSFDLLVEKFGSLSASLSNFVTVTDLRVSAGTGETIYILGADAEGAMKLASIARSYISEVVNSIAHENPEEYSLPSMAFDATHAVYRFAPGLGGTIGSGLPNIVYSNVIAVGSSSEGMGTLWELDGDASDSWSKVAEDVYYSASRFYDAVKVTPKEGLEQIYAVGTKVYEAVDGDAAGKTYATIFNLSTGAYQQLTHVAGTVSSVAHGISSDAKVIVGTVTEATTEFTTVVKAYVWTGYDLATNSGSWAGHSLGTGTAKAVSDGFSYENTTRYVVTGSSDTDAAYWYGTSTSTEWSSAHILSFASTLGTITSSEGTGVYADSSNTVIVGSYSAASSGCFIWAASAAQTVMLDGEDTELNVAVGLTEFNHGDTDFSVFDTVTDVKIANSNILIVGSDNAGKYHCGIIRLDSLGDIVATDVAYDTSFSTTDSVYRFDTVLGANATSYVIACGHNAEGMGAYSTWNDTNNDGASSEGEWVEVESPHYSSSTFYDAIGIASDVYAVGQKDGYATFFDLTDGSYATLSTINASCAYGLSPDGLVAVGESSNAAYVWSYNKNSDAWMAQKLSTGSANAISALNQGRYYTVAGASSNKAAYWFGAGSLWSPAKYLYFAETLGDISSSAGNGISDDASVIVGSYSTTGSSGAFVWDATNATAVSILDTLNHAKVTMTDWTLDDATDVRISEDTIYVVGPGKYKNSDSVYVASFSSSALTEHIKSLEDTGEGSGGGSESSSSDSSGIISLDELNQTIASVSSVSTTAVSLTDIAMTNLSSVSAGNVGAPAIGGNTASSGKSSQSTGLSSGNDNTGHLDAWFVGAVASDAEVTGDDFGLRGGLGLTWDTGSDFRFGLGIFSNARKTATSYGGEQRISSSGPGLFVVWQPDRSPWQISVNGLFQDLSIEVDRGYHNGNNPVTSSGSTSGEAYALSGRIQYSTPVSSDMTFTPFVELSWQTVHVDAYAESDGWLPAQFDARDEKSTATRIGGQLSKKLDENIVGWLSLAWNHRFENAYSAFSCTTDFSSYSLPGGAKDQDWGDVGLGVRWQSEERLSVVGQVRRTVGCADGTEPDVTVSVGLNWNLW